MSPHRTWTGLEALDHAGEELDVGPAGEIIVGTPNATVEFAGEGGAYLVDAAVPGGFLDAVALGAVTSTEDDQVDENLGFEVAVSGDISGDGVPDLVVGAVNETLDDIGYLHLFLGPLTVRAPLVDAWAIIHAEGVDTEPAHAAACGDVNGDGQDDLCVGTNLALEWVFSEAAIFYGPLVPGLIDYQDHSVVLTAPPEEWAGQTLEGGADVDGDGLGDLLVGANKRNDMDGGVYLVSDPGTGTIPLDTFPLWTGEPGTGGHAGDGLAVGGDLDGDGRGDAFVGAPLLDEGRGRGYLVTDVGGGPLAEAYARIDSVRASDWAGYDAAIGDLDGDGAADLAVGIPRDVYFGADRPGRVAVWLGPVAPGPHDDDDASLVFSARSCGADAFGVALDAGDVDGDGVDDLVVGAPLDGRTAEAAGAVHLFLGGDAFR